MTMEADRLTRIHPSPSSVAAARAKSLREEGIQVLDLTVGEPDFDTPDNVKAAGIAAIERGDTKYTAVNGTPTLRSAIKQRLLRHTGIAYSDAEISVGSGAKHVIFTALMATLSPGDEVLIRPRTGCRIPTWWSSTTASPWWCSARSRTTSS